LMYCARHEDFTCVIKLIENGADVNFLKRNDNATALIVALQAIESHSIRGNNNNSELLRIVRVLIRHMSTNALNAKLVKKQDSALSLAMTLGLVDIVHLLIEQGVDIESQRLTIDGSTPLVLSIMCIKLSKQTNIDVQLPIHKEDRIKLAKAFNIFGNAIYTEELDAQLKKVISQLPKESTINPYKNNQEDRYKIFDLILKHTKNINFVDKYNKTALIYSKEMGEKYLVEEILKRR
ncbi:MAG: ankyrin repeat domain-containing protein, partial [Sulfurovum sp.]|nr:ankyrin repeat domain-containing protein [Sulfurovum sp.]NNJ45587.1 ankyrin repeat domain-containing protein [Sulfurovum sp.]